MHPSFPACSRSHWCAMLLSNAGLAFVVISREPARVTSTIMHSRTTLPVRWDPVPEPDPEALRKAFAFIWARLDDAPKSPGNPQAKLTNLAEELEFQGSKDP